MIYKLIGRSKIIALGTLCTLVVMLISFLTINVVHAIDLDTDPDLVGFWKFEEGSGTQAADSSLNGNNGTVNGATWVSGKVGSYALSFNGSSNTVTVPNSASLNSIDTAQQVTVAAWIYPTTAKYAGFMGRTNCKLIVDTLTGMVKFYTGTDLTAATSRDCITTGSWQHVAATYNSGTVKIYVDGVLKVTASVGTQTLSATNLLSIGNITNWNYRFAGMIDDVREYKRELSSSEIEELAGLTPTSTPTPTPTPTPTETPTPIPTSTPVPTVFYTEDFETGYGEWTSTGDVTWYTGTQKRGTHSIRLRNNGSIQRTISTAGRDFVTLSLYIGANSLDSNTENILVQCYNGSIWTDAIKIGNGTYWENNALSYVEYVLPASGSNNSDFTVKVAINGNASNDQAYIDDITLFEGNEFTAPTPNVYTLRQLADQKDFLIGAAYGCEQGMYSSDPFTLANYNTIFANEFNYMTCGWAMQMEEIWTAPGVYNFTYADQEVNFAKDHNIKIKAHSLVWDGSLPSWLEEGSYTNAQIEQMVQDYMAVVIPHFNNLYPGGIACWVVVNEAFKDETYLDENFWYEKLGSNYVEKCFNWAHAVDPDMPLYYNDYGNEEPGDELDAMVDYLGGLKSQGVPITGVGLQLHTSLPEDITPAKLAEALDAFIEEGFEVQVTELDVRIDDDLTGKTQTNLDAQAALIQGYVEVCLERPECKALTFWGFTDRTNWYQKGAALSWIDQGYAEWPMIFDEEYQKKAAYYGVVNALDE